jgi:IMP dehydrogenase
MAELDPRFIGRTFDDFLFRPQCGVGDTRRKIALETRLTASLHLGLPIVSANMDSVTDDEMARAIALEGGIGVIHRATTIEHQAELVRRVKRSHGAVIEDPWRIPRGTSIREAKAIARRQSVNALLIEEEEGSGVLAGLLTARDLPWRPEAEDRPVDDFMTPFDRLLTSQPGIGEDEAEQLMFDRRVERLPLVDGERRIQGLITMRDLNYLRQRPYSAKDAKGRLLVGAAIGARGDFMERAAVLLEAEADCLVVDIAHGHSKIMGDAIEALRSNFGDAQLVCGNVATGEGARFLAERGVDAIKVGVGPGRGCRTRLETGAGVPQLQAIREAWCAVGEEVPIIADGGVNNDKDLFFALVCGASTVMLGSALSGTDEAPGRVIEDPATHTKKKIYRGMTSPQAVFESLYDPEEQDELDDALETPAEGQETQVPYKGSVIDVLRRMRGHLQSSVSYAGEASLRAARDKILADPLAYLTPLSEAARHESFVR